MLTKDNYRFPELKFLLDMQYLRCLLLLAGEDNSQLMSIKLTIVLQHSGLVSPFCSLIGCLHCEMESERQRIPSGLSAFQNRCQINGVKVI